MMNPKGKRLIKHDGADWYVIAKDKGNFYYYSLYKVIDFKGEKKGVYYSGLGAKSLMCAEEIMDLLLN